jgi:hypothetical protein
MLRRALIVLCAAATTAAAAEPAAPRLPPLVVVKDVRATSVAKQDAWVTLAPVVEDSDGEPATTSAWCEGKRDEGLGEAITYTFAEPTAIDTIIVSAGVWTSDKLFGWSNRVLELEVTTDDGRSQVVTPPLERSPTEIVLGGDPVTSITLRIAKVKRGRTNDTCLAEVYFSQGGQVLSPIPGDSAAAGPGLIADLRTARKVLAGGAEAKALAATLDFPFTVAGVAFKDAAALARSCAERGPCPAAFRVDPADERPALVRVERDRRTVAVQFPSGDLWTLRWRAGHWRLLSVL